MEEVRKKCEALKRRPREESLCCSCAFVDRSYQRIFFSANGWVCTLFERLGVCKRVLFAPKEGYSNTSEEYKNLMDLKKKKNKNKKTHLESNTQTGTKECLSVTRSSRYRSIYIDWQRSYDE